VLDYDDDLHATHATKPPRNTRNHTRHRARFSRPSLLPSHTQQWAAEWQEGSVHVSGNPRLSRAINSSLYYLLSSSSPDLPLSLSPGGLASNGPPSPQHNQSLNPLQIHHSFTPHHRLQRPHVLGLRDVDVPATFGAASQHSAAAAAVRARVCWSVTFCACVTLRACACNCNTCFLHMQL